MSHIVYLEHKGENVLIGAKDSKGKTVQMSDIKEATADYSLIEWRLNGLAGEVLTIIDAAIPEHRQNKAIKDLIRQKVRDEFVYFSETLIPEQIREASAFTESMTDKEFEEWAENNPGVHIDKIIAPGK